MALGRGATEEEVNAVRQRRRAEAARKRRAKVSRAENGEFADLEDAPASEELEQFADDDWQNEVLDMIRAMEAPAFERLARQLLLNLGFSHVEVVGKSGDGGVDLLGVVKINDVLTFRVLAQCKRYKGTVAPKDIRDFRGQWRAAPTRQSPSTVADIPVTPERRLRVTAYRKSISWTARLLRNCSKEWRWAWRQSLWSA
jgi:restriction endonuclease Mrr